MLYPGSSQKAKPKGVSKEATADEQMDEVAVGTAS